MRGTRTSLAALLLAVALPLAGLLLWMLHADAWSLGGRSPVLSYDSAQYALAARELATHGRLATTFALPLELSRHARPPWPLAVVQPGLVLAEAALFRAVPPVIRLGDLTLLRLSRPDQREWLALMLPFCCFIVIGLVLASVTSRLFRRHAPQLPERHRLVAALTVGLAFFLDAEAQHYAAGGLTELPFTLGLLLAFAALATGRAPHRPFLFGLLMGVTGLLRANMLWLAPLLALAAAILAPRGRRLRVLALALAGYALPLCPWWIYKWRAFGSPAWDLTKYVIWDGVQGRSWFSLFHSPDPPALPTGLEAARLLLAKILRNLPDVVLAGLAGPRALWQGALVIWLLTVRPWRSRAVPAAVPGSAAAAEPAPGPASFEAPAVAALALLASLAIGYLTAAVSIPWIRFVFPVRIVVEAAGLIALWSLLPRALEIAQRPGLRRIAFVAVGLVALGWGALQTARGLEQARAASATRGIPGALSTLQIAVLMNREIPAGEAVMSNLGPTLAWHARRPVVHLALSPEDLEACRRRLEFRHILLVFRDPESAWPEWREIVARPAEAPNRPEWNVRRAREWRTSDGFLFIWLELGPPGARLAAG